ncbi:hypothetical protein BH23CHL7_BH23CHL7_21680 [soil metagenome]
MTMGSVREIRLALADQIGALEYDGLRRLAQSAQHQLMSDSGSAREVSTLLEARPQRRLLAEAGDDRRSDFESLRDLARRKMANRLKDFPRVRSDNTFKTAINAALRNLVFALVLQDRLSAADFNVLTAPWRNATGWPPPP